VQLFKFFDQLAELGNGRARQGVHRPRVKAHVGSVAFEFIREEFHVSYYLLRPVPLPVGFVARLTIEIQRPFLESVQRQQVKGGQAGGQGTVK